MKADLHIHSIYSDGELTPAEIIAAAKAKNIELVSLTDHDTVSGTNEMYEETKKAGIEFIPGIELSSFLNGEIHILGYNVDICSQKFAEKLKMLKDMRLKRLDEMVKKLNNAGIIIDSAEVLSQSHTGNSVGRVHIAKAVIKKGYAKSVNEVFEKWLGFGKTAYVPSHRLKPSEAVSVIISSGGKAVLAHPSQIGLPQQSLISLIKHLAQNGLSGIEALYFAHTTQENEYYKKLAKDLGLISTCGSDFHGNSRPSEIEAYELDEEDYIRLKS